MFGTNGTNPLQVAFIFRSLLETFLILSIGGLKGLGFNVTRREWEGRKKTPRSQKKKGNKGGGKITPRECKVRKNK